MAPTVPIPAFRAVLDPCLWLLLGLVFSLMRLLQIWRLWPLSRSGSWLQRRLLLQGVMWSMNALQIGVNRIIPPIGTDPSRRHFGGPSAHSSRNG